MVKRMRVGLHHLLWLLLVPLMLFVIALYVMMDTTAQPFTIAVEGAGAHGTLHVDDLFTPLGAGCPMAHWQIDGARAVERDGAPVAAAGSAPLCADSIFVVTFVDGRYTRYVMPGSTLSPHHLYLSGVSAAGLVGGLLWATGLHTRLLDALSGARSPFSASRGAAAADIVAARERRWALVVVTLVIVAGWGLRLAFAVRVPLYGDEAASYLLFAEPPLEIGFPTFWTTNNHPINTLLMHVAMRVWGEGELALRLPALWLGLLALAAIYQAGRTLYSRRVGVLAAALSAMWPFLSEYGWQARGYTGLLLCTFVLLTLAARQARRPTRARWVAYAGVGAVGMYFVSTMIYPFVLVSAWLAAQWWIRDGVHIFRQRRLWALLAAGLAAGLLTLALYTPQIYYLLTTPDRPQDDVAGTLWHPLDRYLFVQLIGGLREEWQFAGSGLSALLLLALSVGVAAAWLSGRRPRGLASDPLLTMLALGLLVLLAHRPSFFLRMWIFFLPLVTITMAVGWVSLSDWFAPRVRWWLATAAATVVLVAGGAYLLANGVAGLPVGSRPAHALYPEAPALVSALAERGLLDVPWQTTAFSASRSATTWRGQAAHATAVWREPTGCCW